MRMVLGRAVLRGLSHSSSSSRESETETWIIVCVLIPITILCLVCKYCCCKKKVKNDTSQDVAINPQNDYAIPLPYTAPPSAPVPPETSAQANLTPGSVYNNQLHAYPPYKESPPTYNQAESSKSLNS